MILDQRPRSDPLGGLRRWGQKLKIQLLQNMVMLHMKLNGLTCRNMVANVPQPDPVGGLNIPLF